MKARDLYSFVQLFLHLKMVNMKCVSLGTLEGFINLKISVLIVALVVVSVAVVEV